VKIDVHAHIIPDTLERVADGIRIAGAGNARDRLSLRYERHKRAEDSLLAAPPVVEREGPEGNAMRLFEIKT